MTRQFKGWRIRDYDPEDWDQLETLEYRLDGMSRVSEARDRSVLEALHSSISSSTIVKVCETDKGEIFLIYGVAPDPENPELGLPWLISTSLIHKFKIQIVKETRRVIKEDFLSQYKYLANVMDVVRQDVLKFAKMVGFKIRYDRGIREIKGIPCVIFAVERGDI
jgi:hypothetical protein